MTKPGAEEARQRREAGRARAGTLLAALLLGVPLAAGALLWTRGGALDGSFLARYFVHPIEEAEVVLFCCALGALLAKLAGQLNEWRVRWVRLLPDWDGKPVPAAEAGKLLSGMDRLSGGVRRSYLARRVTAVLDFVHRRGSAAELDGHLRAQTEDDALALESSYGFVRFVTWAIPILGFLGTVVGITEAIAGVTPEVLEKSLSAVTDGLATAFDTTALALALTMAAMLLSFVVERQEQRTLESVDDYVDRHLAHRFERAGAEGNEVLEAVRLSTQVVVEASEQLVRQQAELWAKTLQEMDFRRTSEEQRQQERFAQALETALERTLDSHARQLAVMEEQCLQRLSGFLGELTALAAAIRDAGSEQRAALERVAEGVAGQARELGELRRGEEQLRRLQETLDDNLAVVAGSETLQEAVHTLSAVAHLLAARHPGDPRRVRLAPAAGKVDEQAA
jgi:biopolymer transport protein ExbB/TolQ